MERPLFVKEVHMLYLDELRKSGVTNMYGAVPYLVTEFGVPNEVATGILIHWMFERSKEEA